MNCIGKAYWLLDGPGTAEGFKAYVEKVLCSPPPARAIW